MQFKRKYRVETSRAAFWNYGSNGIYFITICTKGKKYYFGNILNGVMNLSAIGIMAKKYWFEIPQHFSFVKLGDFVVMPNHVHGILMIDKENENLSVETPDSGVSRSANQAIPLKSRANSFWTPGSLGVIINQYKRICTIKAIEYNAGFAWQPRYYDHIIRRYDSFQAISAYIVRNPEKWEEDRFNLKD